MLERAEKGRMKSSAPNLNPVFCGRCRYHNQGDIDEEEQCRYPDNIKYLDTHMERTKTYRFAPTELNYHNDCDWYEPSLFGRFVLIKETIRAIFKKEDKNKNENE
jgi:hypothetical protein